MADTRRQRVQRAKASLLGDLVNTLEMYDLDENANTAETLGIPVADVNEAQRILIDQLDRWSVRITPLPTPEND